jgi:Arc/MetJ family transcription regulator
MRTTVDMDEKMVKEAMKLTGSRSKTEAINRVLSEFLRQRRREELKALPGKIRIEDNWRETEERELKAQARRERGFHGHR